MKNEVLPLSIQNKIDDEYIKIVKPILLNNEYQLRKNYHHHNNRSVYGHCLLVSIRSYYLCKLLNLDYKSAAIGGLLHDFYYNDWQLNHKKTRLLKAHGFVHAQEALQNSKKNFPELINKKVENIIKRHMFPLNFIPPFYFESWIICFVDKYCSMEIFRDIKNIGMYVGIRKKEKNE